MRQLRNPYVQVGLWTFAITAAVGAVVWTLPWEPEQASSQAGPIDTLYDVLALVSAFVLALVTSIVIVAVVHFRKRRPDDLRDGDPIHGNTRLEVIWTTIPALLMVGTAVYSGLVLADIEESKADTRTVNVTGEQFAWTFGYPQENVRAGELHLVEDTPYLFKLNAKDVIHSFWVPEFRMKKDAVPGMTTERTCHADAQGPVHARLHGALRAGPFHDAGDGGGGGPGGIRPVGAAPEERRGAAAGRGGFPAGEPGRRHRRPAADRRGG